VRRLYNDVTFIDEFLTPEFAMQHKLFTFEWNTRNERFEIHSRKFQQIKDKLLFQLTNMGNPFIYVEDSNYENRGELLLRHEHRGVDLRDDYCAKTMKSLYRLWKRPVVLMSKRDDAPVIMRFDGKEHTLVEGEPHTEHGTLEGQD
jgi:stage V sporulation protein R